MAMWTNGEKSLALLCRVILSGPDYEAPSVLIQLTNLKRAPRHLGLTAGR